MTGSSFNLSGPGLLQGPAVSKLWFGLWSVSVPFLSSLFLGAVSCVGSPFGLGVPSVVADSLIDLLVSLSQSAFSSLLSSGFNL